jgi:hypothetical protein
MGRLNQSNDSKKSNLNKRIKMNIIRYEYNNIDTQSVVNWWLKKLESRLTVPRSATCPATACIEKKDGYFYNFDWVQLVAFDYIELSYYAECKKKQIESLEENDFHDVFQRLFTEKHTLQIIVESCYGFRKFIDQEPVDRYEFMDVPHYKLPSIYQSRAMFELATDCKPIEWQDGRRMDDSYKGSPAFWQEIKKNKYYYDAYPRFGEGEFLPDYIKKVHRSKLD